jgi:aminoglycoside phosphotransferase (APT) family kinase protein
VSEWQAEVDLTPEQAAGLAGRPLSPFAHGWDKTVFLDERGRLVAFCRRGVAVAGMQREINLLPQIAAALPLPVPVPDEVSTYGEKGWPWWSMPLLGGTELALSQLDDRIALARDVGRFLRALHTLPAPTELPLDPMNRSDAVRRAAMARDRLARIGIDPPDSLRTTLGPSRRPPVLSHGDLHLRHVLVAGDRCSGIIDWGDVCLADKSVDVSVAYTGFEGTSRAALLDEYGGVDDECEERARVLGGFLCSALAEHAMSVGNHALLEGSLDGLHRTGR